MSDSIPSWVVRVAWVVSDPSLMSPGIEVDGIQVEHFAPLTAELGARGLWKDAEGNRSEMAEAGG
jgi:hypothetical protein